MPFAIQRVQTDRGTEFFAEAVQRRLMAETIRFRPIAPRSPHLKRQGGAGAADRVGGVLGHGGPKAADIPTQLALWVHYYNWERPHEALQGLTPIDRVCELTDKTPHWGAVSDAYDPMQEHVQVRSTSLRRRYEH